MRKVIFFVICIFVTKGYSQEQKINLYAGIKLRVTPFYPSEVGSLVFRVQGNLNAVQQPDSYISGLGFHTTQTYKFTKKWLINFQQTIRYDALHQVWPLDINEPYRKVGENKRLIFDLNLEFGRRFQRKKNEFTALLGVGISGLNTGYVQVIRQYSNATDFIDYKEDINFLFPTISAGFGWQKGKFLTQIKMGYCWNNPTWSTYPFFFPELSLQYKIK
ncbi:MAG: hypothetical protein V9E96_14805 [Chitinophagaceae bacterium]